MRIFLSANFSEFAVFCLWNPANLYISPVENCTLSLATSPTCAFQELSGNIGVSLASLRLCLSLLSSLEYSEIRNSSSVRYFLLVALQQESSLSKNLKLANAITRAKKQHILANIVPRFPHTLAKHVHYPLVPSSPYQRIPVSWQIPRVLPVPVMVT